MEKRYLKTEASFLGQTSVQITDRATGNVFPESNNNRHYIEYTAWLAEGNEPDVATLESVCEVK